MRAVLRAKVGILILFGVAFGLVVGMWFYFDIRNKTPPGTFTLSSNADSPDSDGTFIVSWTQASRAENYTLYEYSSFITEINASVTSLCSTMIQSKTLTGKSGGMHYFMVEATNAGGTTRSNCLMVSVGWQTWMWETGSDAVNPNGNYGEKNQPSPTNTPGGRFISMSWVGAGGDLWLFGGAGINATGSQGYLNDLWRFNPTSSQWTWVNGSDAVDQYATYGEKGTPSPANTPGGRLGGMTWVDVGGDLWLFGGNGYNESGSFGLLNDVWRFNTTTFEWTWVNGSDAVDQCGTYGEKGTPSPVNTPGGRYGGVSWVDARGDLWLFGGNGYNESGNSGLLNDVWRFNTTSFEWTWVNGSNAVDQYGDYGEKGTPSPANTPGGRYESVSWVDTSGDLWLFGGSGYAASGSGGYLNDLWRLNTSSLEWTWVNGSDAINQVGIYGVKGTPALANIPGGRKDIVSWVDSGGGLWLFGGFGYAASGPTGYLNDLWQFDPTSSQWTWMKGSDITDEEGTYGTRSVPSTTNTPGARRGSVSWFGAGGNLWLFGGHGTASSTSGFLNSLFRYFP